MRAGAGGCGRWQRGVEDAAPYGGRGREAAGCGRQGAAPYGGKVPVLSLRDQSADWSWQSVTPVPFFNVFKWQFENTSIFHFSFFIFHFPQSGYGGLQWRAMLAATSG